MQTGATAQREIRKPWHWLWGPLILLVGGSVAFWLPRGDRTGGYVMLFFFVWGGLAVGLVAFGLAVFGVRGAASVFSAGAWSGYAAVVLLALTGDAIRNLQRIEVSGPNIGGQMLVALLPLTIAAWGGIKAIETRRTLAPSVDPRTLHRRAPHY